jgi:glycogen operon protein
MQYSSRRGPLEVVDEFRDMVKALHRAGIEVILDVVYNHTTEEDAQGPTISFRGFENETYYLLEEDKAVYANYTGCGNTLNASNSIVRRLIIDSLRYWVEEMHVDGFRFDLASILTRDESGKPQANPPVLWDIESHPSLAGIKFIAEAWDAAGLYQVGSFIGDSWREWNGKFRDDVRRFLKGDTGAVSAFVSRLMASPDLFGHERREAEQSINFVTCHDGFTLNDLVSYNTKHNWVNGEKNCDGMDENLSWNCGVEGPAEDPGIEQLRNRQIKNFLTVTLLASGVPMLLMGDEVRRTQGGNNNAYCQDNEISWFDWTLLDKHPDIFRFTKHLIWYRQSRDTAIHDLRLTLHELLAQLRVKWHGVKLNRPDWSDHSHSIAMTTMSVLGRMVIHLMVNAYWQPLTFDVPRLPRYAVGGWRQCLDTSRASPEDIHIMDAAPIYRENNYPVQPRSIAMLVALMAQKPDVSSGRRANVSEENDENFDET